MEVIGTHLKQKYTDNIYHSTVIFYSINLTFDSIFIRLCHVKSRCKNYFLNIKLSF